MDIHGTILDNLERAVASAQRLRGQRVYSDTLAYWASLVEAGHQELEQASTEQSASIQKVIEKLRFELADRATGAAE